MKQVFVLIALIGLSACIKYVYIVKPIAYNMPDKTKIIEAEQKITDFEAKGNTINTVGDKIVLEQAYFEAFIDRVQAINKYMKQLEIILTVNNRKAVEENGNK